MIDCHAHLTDTRFADDRSQVLARARAAGVERILCVGERLSDVDAVLQLGREEERVEPCIGLYPDQLDPADEEGMARAIREHAAELRAIGEVGLDYWIAQEEEQRQRQRELLSCFVALARETDLPLNLHSRSAGHHAVDFLRDLGARKVLLHAFDGRAHHALKAVEAGYLFSIPPSIVRSRQKQKLVRRLPLEVLVLESDSPVLGPDPRQRNEPANLVRTVEMIAQIKACDPAAVVSQTSANARRLFSLE
jgi:TatD DNase family protein